MIADTATLAPLARADTQTLTNMRRLAHQIIASRTPDKILGGGVVERWCVTPPSAASNFFVHRFLRSDNEFLHDHPWDHTAIVLENEYVEITADGYYTRGPGDIIKCQAHNAHRIVVDGLPVITFCFTGARVREWGYHTYGDWIAGSDFVFPDAAPLSHVKAV